MNRTVLRRQLVKHEGLELMPYRDTVGKWTIGVGRNYEDNPFTADERKQLGLDAGRRIEDGITEDEAMYLLDNDITKVWKKLSVQLVGVFTSLDCVRQHVLLDMGFNLGVAGLLRFRNMLAAVERRDFVAAKAEMLDSRWAKQVGDKEGQRAWTLANMMETGVA